MRIELQGVAASRGLVMGRARVRQPHRLQIVEERIAAAQVEPEILRLLAALQTARAELLELRAQLQGAIAHELGEFLDLHALLLDDPELRVGLEDLIRTGRFSAAYALKLQHDKLSAVFDGIDDPYLRSRREDLDHAIGRVYAALLRHDGHQPQRLAGEILVTDTVAPSEFAQLLDHGTIAVVTAQGSALSHSAILARSLHLPLVVGIHEALGRINDGQALIVDGSSGRVIVEPDARDLRRFRQQLKDSDREQRQLARLRGAPTRTLDGCDVQLHANAESREDVSDAFALGVASIGLFRTEFLFLRRSAVPDEEEQFLAYRDLVLGMGERPVTIRTLDLGADKSHASGLGLAGEPNPALGVRGVRLSLAREPLFRAQLRAILRASGYGRVRILVPMISCREEMLQVRALVDDCARELRSEGHEIADHFRVGAMIEVPAAAFGLRRLLPVLDFVSIGTNDLVQYMLAVDRNNDALAELYSPLHPGIVRLLSDMIALGRRAGKPLLLCGEMAGDPHYTRLLLALGLTELSMHPATLLEVRQVVRQCDLSRLRAAAPALLRAPDRTALERLVERL